MQHDLFAELASPRIFTVSELTRFIRSTLENSFPEVWVDGEISNLRTHSSGHTYFTLKDEKSQIRSVIFRHQKGVMRFRPEDGQRVIVRGRVTVYEPRGEYQILVDYLEPKGVGALQVAFEQLKRKLADEGLFDESRKKPLPLLPQRIGVVTSPTGAAIRDILRVITRRFANVEILLNPVRVQGEGAAEEIAHAVDVMNRYTDVDVLIVGRGGGSLEDLWAFNEEAVARAIARSRIPVISAVGHEIDFTIADLVADVRAPTPSAAAEMVVKDKEELEQGVASSRQRIVVSLRALMDAHRRHLGSLTGRRVLTDPLLPIAELQQRVDETRQRAERAMATKKRQESERLAHTSHKLALLSPRDRVASLKEVVRGFRRRAHQSALRIFTISGEKVRRLAASLDALSPLAILARGYAICRLLPCRTVVKDAALVAAGEHVEVLVHKGKMICEVEQSLSEGKGDGGKEV